MPSLEQIFGSSEVRKQRSANMAAMREEIGRATLGDYAEVGKRGFAGKTEERHAGYFSGYNPKKDEVSIASKQAKGNIFKQTETYSLAELNYFEIIHKNNTTAQ